MSMQLACPLQELSKVETTRGSPNLHTGDGSLRPKGTKAVRPKGVRASERMSGCFGGGSSEGSNSEEEPIEEAGGASGSAQV